jgi:hypothetical protein
MQENYLGKSFVLLALVLVVLLSFSALPEFSIGPWKLRKVNLLADIQPDPVKLVAKKKDPVKKEVRIVVRTDSCRPGITCIEDYGRSKKSLASFFRALRETHIRPVRIAFFGDSFIEGDILCGSLRDTLQHLFGGHGVGFMPITSDVSEFRTTIRHSFSHWKTYSIVGAKSPFSPPGTSGYCFVPLEGNEVEYRPAWKKSSGRFHTIRLFYKNPSSGFLHYLLNDTLELSSGLKTSDSLQEFVLPEKGVSSVKFQFTAYDSMKVYGASFEEPVGIYVDNFSMRGNAGTGLYQIEPQLNREFNHFQDYKLILLQYGLNVVTENDSTGYAWYIEQMVRVVNRIKENFPASSILLIGVSDRSSNQGGTFATMPNILLMRDAQREIAIRSQIAFWDLYAAMGGKNSMLKFVNATPPLAAKDYTHLNYGGGRKLAKKLADAVLYERIRYEAKKQALP